jgi:adenylate cyclase class 2
MQHHEIEGRFLEINKEAVCRTLAAIGATDYGDHLLDETIFEVVGDQNKILKLRSQCGVSTLISKERFSGQPEFAMESELIVTDVEAAKDFISALGFPSLRVQQKMRHTFRLGDLTFDIDLWPLIPPYLEIEGPDLLTVQRAAELLGLAWNKMTFADPREIIVELYGIPLDALGWYTFNHIERHDAQPL